MDFRYKNILQQIFSKIPYGEKANFIFQKYVTKGIPPSDKAFIEKVERAFRHHQNYLEFNQVISDDRNYYEFGAGWTLTIPLTMGFLGYNSHCIDIRKLTNEELISYTFNQFFENNQSFEFEIAFQNFSLPDKKIFEYLKKKLNLSYHAPRNAKATTFSEEFFSHSSSTSTFEHLPKEDILQILNETYRILKKGGIFSIVIDYKDHWSYFDSSITKYNFLRYSESEWEKYNPSLHYQNRLRHSEYLDIISNTDFEMVKCIENTANHKDLEELKSLPLSKVYAEMSLDDLCMKGSEIILRK